MTGWIAPLPAQGAQEEEEGFHAPEIGEFFPAPIFDGTIFHFTRIHLVMVVMTLLTSAFFIAAFRKPRSCRAACRTSASSPSSSFGYRSSMRSSVRPAGASALPDDPVLVRLRSQHRGHHPVPQHLRQQRHWPAADARAHQLADVQLEGIANRASDRIFGGICFPRRTGADLRAGDADRIRLDVHSATRHAHHPAARQHARRAPASRSVLQCNVLLASRRLWPAEDLQRGIVRDGVIFTLFEILVAFLQAYIFALLTAVYIGGALAPDH